MSKIYYHYCSLETLIHIITDKKIRLCNISKMNDEQECINIEEILLKTIVDKELDKTNPEIIDLVKIYRDYKDDRHMPYIACFSQENDRLSQWRAYANDGQGVCIGFDFEEFEDIEEQSPSLVKSVRKSLGYSKVIYSLEEKIGTIGKILTSYDIIRKDLNKELNGREIKRLNDFYASKLLEYSTIFKNDAFDEEAEYRIIYLPFPAEIKQINELPNSITLYNLEDRIELQRGYYSKGNTIVGFYEYLFNETAIKSIVLGPKCKLDVDDIDLKNLLKDNNIKAEVSKSKASYR
ncbi:DUF2971 domain-containing protein [uncultured Clostridium sp.]|uniref:DUF2971 domain-containing protein n=1 Tax=uncultured Clostridium sp. TaxID=59620 RepID=UPI0025EEE888|nr:DUF2971 domain-containing protein [uncultured Clostridium sp.]MDU4884321.1 DUF2971 domain-containing protein [Clostridium celatum]MDU7077479.1 DUF2971 domain-containing protein [Clostridium celatum]